MSTHSLPRYRVTSSSPHARQGHDDRPLHGEDPQRTPPLMSSRQTRRPLLKGAIIMLSSALLVIVAVYAGRAGLTMLQTGAHETPAPQQSLSDRPASVESPSGGTIPASITSSVVLPAVAMPAVTMPQVAESADGEPHRLSAREESNLLSRFAPGASAAQSLFM